MNLIFDFSDALRMGMGIAFAPQNIGFCVAGCLVGVLICGLGGLRAIAAMALLLPFAVRLSPASGLVLLVGGYGGAQVMRSAALRRIEPARDGMGIGMAGPLAGFAGVGVIPTK